MTCEFQSGERGPYKCALGNFGGRPFLGQCLRCLKNGWNIEGKTHEARMIWRKKDCADCPPIRTGFKK